jgi:hypothetical protein
VAFYSTEAPFTQRKGKQAEASPVATTREVVCRSEERANSVHPPAADMRRLHRDVGFVPMGDKSGNRTLGVYAI